MLKNKDSPLNNCVTLSVTSSRLGSTNKFSVDIWEVVPSKFLKRITKEQVHILQKSKGPLVFGFLLLSIRFFIFWSKGRTRRHPQHLNAGVVVCKLNLQSIKRVIYRSNLQCVYRNRSHPDNENQLDGRTETIDSKIFKSS